jgi:hypothetical protein
MVTYWKYVKKEKDVFIFDRKPKPPFVVEYFQRVGSMFESHTRHTLMLNGDADQGMLVVEAYCGYDRGPKLRSAIRKVLGMSNM